MREVSIKKMGKLVPIRISKSVRTKLKQKKITPRETYDDTVKRLLSTNKKRKLKRR